MRRAVVVAIAIRRCWRVKFFCCGDVNAEAKMQTVFGLPGCARFASPIFLKSGAAAKLSKSAKKREQRLNRIS